MILSVRQSFPNRLRTLDVAGICSSLIRSGEEMKASAVEPGIQRDLFVIKAAIF